MRAIEIIKWSLMALIISSNSCDSENNLYYPPLSLNRIPYSGNQLRIDGYYYQELDSNDPTLNGHSFFFYDNGILFNGGGYNILRKNECEANFRDSTYLSAMRNHILGWGIFQIDVDSIQFEKWYPSSGGPLLTYVRAGKIPNDSTFNITHVFSLVNGVKSEVRVVNEVYHFMPFSPKPDSVNSFIK